MAFDTFLLNLASTQKSPQNPHRPMGIHHSPHTHPIPIPMGMPMGIQHGSPGIQGLPKVLDTPYYLRNGKSYTNCAVTQLLMLYTHFRTTYSNKSPLKILGIVGPSHGRSQGLSKLSRASICMYICMYTAHRAVTFAIAWHSC